MSLAMTLDTALFDMEDSNDPSFCNNRLRPQLTRELDYLSCGQHEVEAD